MNRSVQPPHNGHRHGRHARRVASMRLLARIWFPRHIRKRTKSRAGERASATGRPARFPRPFSRPAPLNRGSGVSAAPQAISVPMGRGCANARRTSQLDSVRGAIFAMAHPPYFTTGAHESRQLNMRSPIGRPRMQKKPDIPLRPPLGQFLAPAHFSQDGGTPGTH